jgi:hypothetical protein
MAVLRRGGLLPQADVYPAAMRATRDLLRRRLHRTRQRAELLAHVQHPHSQDNLPELRKPLADKANRAGVAARCPDPAVQKRVAGDLALMDSSERWRSAVELTSVQTATQHHAQTRYRRPSVPGLGKILRVVLLDEIHDLARVPRLQAGVSSGRRLTWATEAAGTRAGTSGAKLGHAERTWAFSAAAVWCWRNTPAGQTALARGEKPSGQGHA